MFSSPAVSSRLEEQFIAFYTAIRIPFITLSNNLITEFGVVFEKRRATAKPKGYLL